MPTSFSHRYSNTKCSPKQAFSCQINTLTPSFERLCISVFGTAMFWHVPVFFSVSLVRCLAQTRVENISFTSVVYTKKKPCIQEVMRQMFFPQPLLCNAHSEIQSWYNVFFFLICKFLQLWHLIHKLLMDSLYFVFSANCRLVFVVSRNGAVECAADASQLDQIFWLHLWHHTILLQDKLEREKN